MHHRSRKVDDRVRSVLVRVELDESEPAVGLETDFDDVAETLEEGDQVGLGDEGDEVADVDGRVGCRGLGHDRLELWRKRA